MPGLFDCNEVYVAAETILFDTPTDELNERLSLLGITNPRVGFGEDNLGIMREMATLTVTDARRITSELLGDPGIIPSVRVRRESLMRQLDEFLGIPSGKNLKDPKPEEEKAYAEPC